MNYIKKMIVRGFKTFQDFTIDFNSEMNIIIGENESGKSTILEAIDVVLNKKYLNYDKYIIREIINKDLVKQFEETKDYDYLPVIEIFLFLNLDNTCDINHEFKGEVIIDNSKIEDYGIKFTCKFNDDFRDVLIDAILEGKIPYDYYEMSWDTFQGKAYNSLRKPLKYLSIDNSKTDGTNAFNYYNKNLFHNKFDNLERMKICNNFRSEINQLLNELEILDNNTKFGIDNRKVILDNIITVLEDEIPLENKGKGKENLIKTEIVLNKNKGNIEVLAVEEPENHLSHINLRKMLENIKNINEDDEKTQVIITTHNSLIVNTLDLSNVIWINNNKSNSLKSISNDKAGKKSADFFSKADNLNLLQFILSKKVILVEGPTEYMIMQKAYENITEKLKNKDNYADSCKNDTAVKNLTINLEQDGIEIISCGGVGYNNYIEIAKTMDKRIAILTDNDNKTNEAKLNEIKEFNKKNTLIKIFTDENKDNWTWEVSLYNLNKELLESKIKLEKNAVYSYKVKDTEYTGCLGKMLNNKADTAYLLTQDDIEIEYPSYFEECIKWIRE